MNQIERINYIKANIDRKEKMKIKEIHEIIPEVSLMTLNRDLRKLIELKWIFKLSYYYCSQKYYETALDKEIINKIDAVNEKNIIGNKANSILKQNDIIFVSPGTTSQIFVEKINKKCTVYTNSLKIFLISKENNKVKSILIGGEDKNNKNIFTGTLSVRSLLELKFNKVFLSVTGITESGQLLKSNKEEALIETIAANNTDEIIIISDSNKMTSSIKGNYVFYNIEKCNYLITDNKKVINKFNWSQKITII